MGDIAQDDERKMNILHRYLHIKDTLKIYIYNYYPSGFSGLQQFIDATKKNRDYDWGETYKAWLYFIDYVLHSPMYTSDPSIADYFVVPQWENLYRGRNFYNDFIMPLKNATESEYYRKTSPKRNHIFIYISDDTPLFDNRIPIVLRSELKKRFIRLTHSGRITNFGKFHNASQSESIFKFQSSDEIVIPPGVPIQYDCSTQPTKQCEYDVFYEGDLDPPSVQTERKDSLQYMKKNFRITNKLESSLCGIHCAGFGIWTARLYNYLNAGVIPIIFSDGVILPFESFFNYKSFTMKILGSTCDSNGQTFVNDLTRAGSIYRKQPQDTEEKVVYDRIIRMQNNIKEIAPWFHWKSTDPYKNPFTLISIELYNRLHNTYVPPTNPIAKEEYYDFNVENLSLYKTI